MKESPLPSIAVADLRIGIFVHLDVGWMDHPFPLSSFKITSQQQIDTIRSLGKPAVRWSPDKSDPPEGADKDVPTPPPTALDAKLQAARAAAEQERLARRALLNEQTHSLMVCERHFTDAARSYRQVVEEMDQHPVESRERAQAVVSGFVDQMLGNGESVIRLLSEGLGDRASLHSVNVTVLSLLLGKAMGMGVDALNDLGNASLIHDVGKSRLADRVRFREEHFTPAEHKLYQGHVAHSAAIAKQMGFSVPTLLGISQHHEMEDGSGFPLGLKGDKISPLARVLALVNRYDNLCNPGNPSGALTPHEALSLIFAQMKARFDMNTLGAFIRMMGVYPPGSVVQLVDSRYAMVVSVNSSRPLRPRIIIHEPSVPKDEALILDLETQPELGIKRSVRPLQLPKATIDYLSPRQRICYFFERAADPLVAAADA